MGYEMELNTGNSIFDGLNSKRGIMICGYEWGFSKQDQLEDETHTATPENKDARTIFSNKSPRFGDKAFYWKYDNRIIKWFELWGHRLSRDGLGGDFEKTLMQTNWCDTQGHSMPKETHAKLLDKYQVDNFIYHIRELDPSLILFMGSALIQILQNEKVLGRFSEIMGGPTSAPRFIQKEFSGRRFKIGFQSFSRCDIASLPHPSGTRGLSDDYIELYSEEIGGLIKKVKSSKGILN